MKNPFLKLSLVALPVLGILLASPAAKAQEPIGEVIKAGQRDASILIKAYAEPGGRAMGHALNGGWFNSGKAMELGKFDVRVFVTAVFTPEDQTTFDVSKLNLERMKLSAGESPIAPTLFGDNEEGPQLEVQSNSPGERVIFRTPAGIGYRNVPIPMAQVSFGLIKDTEVAVRFVPKTTYEEYSAKLWGVGVKHGIKQYIPVLSAIPDFDIAVFGGFTSFETAADLEINPDPVAARSPSQQQPGYYDNQQLVFTTKAWTTSLVAAKTVGVLGVYGGVKYSHVISDINVNGRYPITAFKITPPNRYIVDTTDPVAVNIGDSQLGLTGGLRLKLSIFSIYAEGTWAKYPSATAGIGLGLY
ncbi:DUF6588 family protein [Rufibacter tibetensis]|uniref:Uncharacterized protein n=1 Tax=Rufibacter tibetensis TaxID=512763 RepID=A0A0P0C7N0_9BACT|nr:DUF6588 family protein [Rufibacter tibetensis]ALI99422.1 hypothetical protein DC20_11160 [Rufibacter tibetensis]